MFKVYQGNESCQFDDLTVENQADVINIYGNLQLYQDRQSLVQAQQLLALLQDVVQHLQGLEQQQKLVDKINIKPTRWVDNPFDF
ncbi:hypothetical protein [Moraxella sp. ZY210820]|uniref:hypothetical protein n=1 Tax=unclassified Moraxella TaxID=2685852 RepID=UPI00273193DD|nr:hypothetical protein [Moraxella sp. ZY210820]WLF84587.1 hypothetical protein LU301_03700 [Moraxella sp. ZY210820]